MVEVHISDSVALLGGGQKDPFGRAQNRGEYVERKKPKKFRENSWENSSREKKGSANFEKEKKKLCDPRRGEGLPARRDPEFVKKRYEGPSGGRGLLFQNHRRFLGNSAKKKQKSSQAKKKGKRVPKTETLKTKKKKERDRREGGSEGKLELGGGENLPKSSGKNVPLKLGNKHVPSQPGKTGKGRTNRGKKKKKKKWGES